MMNYEYQLGVVHPSIYHDYSFLHINFSTFRTTATMNFILYFLLYSMMDFFILSGVVKHKMDHLTIYFLALISSSLLEVMGIFLLFFIFIFIFIFIFCSCFSGVITHIYTVQLFFVCMWGGVGLFISIFYMGIFEFLIFLDVGAFYIDLDSRRKTTNTDT